MRKQEILWRNPEYVEQINALADEMMAKLLPETRALFSDPINETDARKFLMRTEARDRALASKLGLIKAIMGLTPKPVTEDEEQAQKQDADTAKILEAVRANRPVVQDISKFTPDTSGLAKPRPVEDD